jgi:hypothetical protein
MPRTSPRRLFPSERSSASSSDSACWLSVFIGGTTVTSARPTPGRCPRFLSACSSRCAARSAGASSREDGTVSTVWSASTRRGRQDRRLPTTARSTTHASPTLHRSLLRRPRPVERPTATHTSGPHGEGRQPSPRPTARSRVSVLSARGGSARLLGHRPGAHRRLVVHRLHTQTDHAEPRAPATWNGRRRALGVLRAAPNRLADGPTILRNSSHLDTTRNLS